MLTLIPLLVGNVVRAAGWLGLLGNDGLINASLRGLGVIAAPLQLIYTPGAVAIGTIAVVLPYMILTLSSVIERSRGQSRRRRPIWVPAPSRCSPGGVAAGAPGTVAGCVLVFILCMNTYATAVLLGGSQFKMMAPAVYDQFSKSTNWPFGAALAFILLAATLVLTALGTALLGRRYAR